MAREFLNKGNIPRGGGQLPKINFELFGDWDRTMGVIKNMGPAVKDSSVKAQIKVGKEILKKVKGHLRSQDLGWQALSDHYVRRKSSAGFDTRILVGYGSYYRNLEVWQSGNRHLVFIGVRRGIYTQETSGKKSKIDIATIAGIHEFSSGKRIPKRPLWNPSIAQMGGAKGIKTMYINSFIWHLRAKGIPVTKTFFGDKIVTTGGTKLKF